MSFIEFIEQHILFDFFFSDFTLKPLPESGGVQCNSGHQSVPPIHVLARCILAPLRKWVVLFCPKWFQPCQKLEPLFYDFARTWQQKHFACNEVSGNVRVAEDWRDDGGCHLRDYHQDEGGPKLELSYRTIQGKTWILPSSTCALLRQRRGSFW